MVFVAGVNPGTMIQEQCRHGRRSRTMQGSTCVDPFGID
jgi:hypothetical protein